MPESAMELNSPGYNVTAPTGDAVQSTAASSAPLMSVEGDTALPDQVAYVPDSKPTADGLSIAPDASVAVAAEATSDEAAAAPAEARANAQGAEQTVQVASAPAAPEAQAVVTAADMPPVQPIEPKKKGFLSAFFGSTQASAAQTPIVKRAEKPTPVFENNPDRKPLITMASAKSADKPLELASLGGVDSGGIGSSALPGVRQTALFEIKRKSGIDDDSDVDLHEEEDEGPVQLASAAGLARLAPNGLLKQTDRVDTACLKPSLVRVLKQIERHYGKRMIVTSGYRSPARNRAARGAKNSLHMYCAAVDIQIPGVDKWQLAAYARSMPGRGGVGTYCHTESVHVDVGPERDWNWRCRRRKA